MVIAFIARAAATTADRMARPAPSPPTRATRGRLCAASRLTEKPPSALRSKGAPSAASHSTVSRPRIVRARAASASTRPAPAPSVSFAWSAALSLGDRAAAIPPCAQAEEQAFSKGSGVTTSTLPPGPSASAASSAADRPASPPPMINGPS
ncbi:hypothetical protein D3C77_368570 [compost metagenome]